MHEQPKSVRHQTFRDLLIGKPYTNPQSRKLRLTLEKPELVVMWLAGERIDEENGFGPAEINCSCPSVKQPDLDLIR